MFICMQKINFIFNSDIVKTLQTCYFENFGNAWPSPSKLYYQFVVNCHAYMPGKNQLHHSIFFKILEKNSKLVILGHLKVPGHTPKMIIGIWKNLWHLSADKRSRPSFTFSSRCYKDIVNLLFWVLWAYLVKQTQSDTINL